VTLPAKPAPKPRWLSAAVTGDSALTALPGWAKPLPESLGKPGGAGGPPGEDAVLTGSPGDSTTAPASGKDQEAHGFSAVSLLDHHSGQCRWIVSDVWPVMYCGAPVVDSSSWCEQHSKRVFNPRPQGLSRKFQLKAWP
jgi:hypothetical protein